MRCYASFKQGLIVEENRKLAQRLLRHVNEFDARLLSHRQNLKNSKALLPS
jgi:hypothetical protein